MADNAVITILFTSSVIVFICVWILNPLTIAAILKSNAIRTTYSNIFILNLAVADLILITVAVALTAQRIHGNVEFSNPVCISRVIVSKTLVMGSILSSFAIAVDRFLYIAKPLRYPSLITHARVLGSVGVAWLLSLTNSSLPFFTPSGTNATICHDPTKGDRLISVSMAIMFTVFILLQVISTCMYIKMFLIIQKHHKLVESLSIFNNRSISSGKGYELVKTGNSYRTSSLRVRSENHQISSAPSAGLEFSNLSSNSLSDNDLEIKFNGLYSDIIENDESGNIQQLEITPNAPTLNEERENVVSERHDNLQSNCQNGTRSFWKEAENNENSNTERKVKAIYHIPFSTRGKKLTITSRQSWPSGKEDQSRSRISRKEASRRRKCRYSLRDFRTIKTLMLMGNLYFLCWSPWITMVTLQEVFHIEINSNLQHGVAILGILNSILNFIVYPLRKADLRNTFKTMLLPLKKRFLSLFQS